MRQPSDQRRPGRVILVIERIAGALLGLVTLMVFASALGRYLFGVPIPDAFDLSRLTLAVAVVWGFASLGFRGSHIKVDLLAQLLGPRVRRWMDLAAWSILWIFTALLVWKIGGRVLRQFPGGETTMDLRLPHWPFLLAILAGLVAALVTTALRLWLMAARGETLEAHETLPTETRDGP